MKKPTLVSNILLIINNVGYILNSGQGLRSFICEFIQNFNQNKLKTENIIICTDNHKHLTQIISLYKKICATEKHPKQQKCYNSIGKKMATYLAIFLQ